VSGPSGPLLRTTVLCVVVLSVAIFGGTTPQVVHLLGIKTGVPQPDSSDEDDSDGAGGQSADDSPSDSDSDGPHAPVIDLSSGGSRVPRESATQAVDVFGADAAGGSQAQIQINMGDLPSPRGRLSSPWGEPDESWLTRIKNSYRSFDRSLIYDLDRHYIRPLLTRQDSIPDIGTGHGRRRRHRSHASHNTGRGRSGSSAGPRGARQAYSSTDLATGVRAAATVSPWSNYRPDDAIYGNWGSGASDAGASSESRAERPLLRKND
ncbi:monovalent cation:H+ antiporter, CPA1 (nhx1), partial [Coemansia spiralis]